MQRLVRSAVFLIIFLFASVTESQAAISVSGISDREIENDMARITVPSESGFEIVALLNGGPVVLDTEFEVTTPGYYELAVTKTDLSNGNDENVLFRFIVLDSSRGTSERGLVDWVPYPTIDSAPQAFAGSELEMIMPAALPRGFAVPLVARLREIDSGRGQRLNGTVRIPELAGAEIRLLRGYGSGIVPALAEAGVHALTPGLHGLASSKQVVVEADPSWTAVSGTIASNTAWSSGARIHVTDDLTISEEATLRIGAGCVVQLSPGVEIELNGRIEITGTLEEPVLFASVPGENPWGGVLVQGSEAEVRATGVMFTGSGADDNWFGGSGYSSHRDEQAAFLFDTGTRGFFTDCFFLDLAGQALHGRNAMVALTDCLVQRVPTVGQFNGGEVTVTRSALIEFDRNDSLFADADNDGIYFTTGSHRLIDSVIGWAKDDGVDAGSGSSGMVTVDGCWFEACFHEGMAWSGAGRTVNVSDSVVVNCGQGIEAGWSEGANSPVVNVTASLCVGNHVGWRFGDNYDWNYNGLLNVADSLALFNDRDVWGFEWDSWSYRVERMSIENNKLSEANPRHPDNEVWDAASDAAMLERFSPVPGAPVGCGFGEWTLQRPESSYGEPVVVALSEFATEQVAIDYEIAVDFEVVATGRVEFAPGEVRRAIAAPALESSPRKLIRLTLTGAEGAQLTGPRNLFYLPDGGSPEGLVAPGSEWRYLDDGSDQGTAWREPGFDDRGWRIGSAEFGYGDGDELTEVRFGPNEDNSLNDDGAKYITTYFRREFHVPDAAQVGTLDLRIKRDDGMVVYLNGREIARDNLPANPNYLTEADNGSSEEDLFLEYPGRDRGLLVTGANTLAVEIHQDDAQSSDISFDLELVARPSDPLVFLFVRSGGELNLVWEGEADMLLQSSTDLQPDWTGHPGARSPLRLRPSGTDPRKFYRLVR